jgi:hypothetical protein
MLGAANFNGSHDTAGAFDAAGSIPELRDAIVAAARTLTKQLLSEALERCADC